MSIYNRYHPGMLRGGWFPEQCAGAGSHGETLGGASLVAGRHRPMGQPALVITVRGCRAADQQIFFVILWYEMVYRSVDANRSLTAAFVKGVRHSGKPHGPDKYCDQHGLILRILPTDSKQWIWRGTIHGKRVDLGLGSWPYVSLADARQAAFEHRKLARAGGDPRTLRASLGISMFAEAVEKVIAMHEPNWKDGARSAEIWRSSLSRYAMPRLGAKRISDIETADVMAVLLPIWASKRDGKAGPATHRHGHEVGRRSGLSARQSRW